MIRYVYVLLTAALAVAAGPGLDPAEALDGVKKQTKAEIDCASEGSSPKSVAEEYGIEPLQIRLTGAGHFLDFRYRVIDAEKAKPILKKDAKAYLVDQDSGKTLTVPVTKIGSMRGTTRAPKEGRQYFILFANANGIIDSGSRVTVVINEIRIEGLVVE